MEKCKLTRKHKCSFTIRKRAITRGNACSPIARQALPRHHGYSHEWLSGQKPRLIKDGKSIICKTDNFVPLVVPGLSTNLESSSSSASLTRDSLRREAEQAPNLRQVSPQVQFLSEVTNEHPGDWCNSQESKTKIKNG